MLRSSVEVYVYLCVRSVCCLHRPTTIYYYLLFFKENVDCCIIYVTSRGSHTAYIKEHPGARAQPPLGAHVLRTHPGGLSFKRGWAPSRHSSRPCRCPSCDSSIFHAGEASALRSLSRLSNTRVVERPLLEKKVSANRSPYPPPLGKRCFLAGSGRRPSCSTP